MHPNFRKKSHSHRRNHFPQSKRLEGSHIRDTHKYPQQCCHHSIATFFSDLFLPMFKGCQPKTELLQSEMHQLDRIQLFQ